MIKKIFPILFFFFLYAATTKSQVFIPFGFWSGVGKSVVWDATTLNNQIDNGSGTWTSSSTTFTTDGGISDVAFVSNSTPVFGYSSSVGTAGTVTVSGTQNVGGLSFYPVPSGDFTLSSGTLNFITPVVYVVPGRSPTISSVISGSTGLNLMGGGSLILTGANTYTGTTIVNSGSTLQSGATAATSTASFIPGTSSITNDGTLNFILSSATGFKFPDTYTYSGTGNLSITSGNIVYTGPFSTGGLYTHNQTSTTNYGCSQAPTTVTAGSAYIAGPIFYNTGNTALYKVDTSSSNGNQTLSSVVFGNPGTCWSFNNNVFSAGTGTINVLGNNVFNWWNTGATYTLNGQVTGSGNFTYGSYGSGTATLSLNNPGSSTYSGVISGANYNVSFGGTGTQIITGTHTYTGTTSISNGTLQISGAGSLGSGTYAATISNTGSLKYSSSTNQTFSGVISGTGTLIKDTSSTSILTLSAANTYSGKTTINAGTVLLSANGTYSGGFDVSTNGILIQNASMGGGYPNMGTINIYGNGTASTNGFYVGNYTNAYLNLVNGPTTIRKYSGASGTAVLAGFDINGIHLNCTAAASGSIIDSSVQLLSGGYGYSMNVVAGSAPLGYDLEVQGHINANSSMGLFFSGTGTIKLSGDFASGNRIDTSRGLAKLIIGNAFIFNAGATSTTPIYQGTTTIDWATTANNSITGDWTGTGTFLKSGTGSLTLSGSAATRTFSGPITISAGTLKAGSLNAFGTSTITCAATCTPATCIINKGGFAITNTIVNSSACNIIP